MARESGLSHDKIPVQCLDNPFGFNAEVVYGDQSFPVHQCTPFLTINRIQHRPTTYTNERPYAEAEDIPEPRHQMQNTLSADNRRQPNVSSRPVSPEDTDAYNNSNQQTFTDGGSPLTMAIGGMRNYNPMQMESLVLLDEEEWEKPKTRMKKSGKRGGKKSRRKQRV